MSAPRRAPRPKRIKPAPEHLLLDNQLCFPLYAAARLVVNAYRPLLEPLGLTYPQYLVLLVLWETDGQSVSQIGERLHLDSGTLTGLLKRLEQQGLIARRRDAEDDRVVGNWLSDKGQKLKQRAMSVPSELLCRAELGMDDVVEMKGMLDRLIVALLPLQE
jgi:DNA-binding MarR family transcriptional regulator